MKTVVDFLKGLDRGRFYSLPQLLDLYYRFRLHYTDVDGDDQFTRLLIACRSSARFRPSLTFKGVMLRAQDAVIGGVSARVGLHLLDAESVVGESSALSASLCGSPKSMPHRYRRAG